MSDTEILQREKLRSELRLDTRTWVVRWEGKTFTYPVPLIKRSEIKVDDRIATKVLGGVYVSDIERAPVEQGGLTVWLRRLPSPTNASIQPWFDTGSPDDLFPLLSRGWGITFGDVAGRAQALRIWGEDFERIPPQAAGPRTAAAARVQKLIRERSGGLITPDSTFAGDIVTAAFGDD